MGHSLTTAERGSVSSQHLQKGCLSPTPPFPSHRPIMFPADSVSQPELGPKGRSPRPHLDAYTSPRTEMELGWCQ